MIVQNLGDIFYSNIIEHLKLCCFKFGLWNNAWFVEKEDKIVLRVSLWCYRKEGWWRSNLLDPNPRIRILPEKNDRPRNVEGVPCQDPGDVPKIIWNENFQIIVSVFFLNLIVNFRCQLLLSIFDWNKEKISLILKQCMLILFVLPTIYFWTASCLLSTCKVPYKSRNFGQFFVSKNTIRLIRGSVKWI